MSFLDDIKNQSQHVREIMFGLSVFITVMLVGIIWFHSFQRNIYVLLNPEDGLEKALAVESAPVPSLFGFIGKSLGDVKGLVSGFLGGEDAGVELKGFRDTNRESKVYTLPLSDYK